MTREELIAKLCAAAEGSAELDAEIVACQRAAILRPYPPSTDFGPQNRWQFWSKDGAHFLANEDKWHVHPFTGSIDFALTLVPSDWFVELQRFSDGWYATVAERSNCGPCFDGTQKPAALALCIAALKASS